MKTFYTKMYLMKILQCIHAQYTKSKETKKMGYVDEVLAKVKEKMLPSQSSFRQLKRCWSL